MSTYYNNNKQVDAIHRITMFLVRYAQYTWVDALVGVNVWKEGSTPSVVMISLDINRFMIGEVTRKESKDGMDWIERISDTEENERFLLHVRLNRFGFQVRYKEDDADTLLLIPVSE